MRQSSPKDCVLRLLPGRGRDPYQQTSQRPATSAFPKFVCASINTPRCPSVSVCRGFSLRDTLFDISSSSVDHKQLTMTEKRMASSFVRSSSCRRLLFKGLLHRASEAIFARPRVACGESGCQSEEKRSPP